MSAIRNQTIASRGTLNLLLHSLFFLPASAPAANLVSVIVNPTHIVAGSPLEMTFTLDAPAPPGNAEVMFTASPSGIVDVPPQWGVFAGDTSRSILVLTRSVDTTADVTITATYGSVSKTAVVTVAPRVPVRGAAGDLWADIILGKPDFGEITPNQVTANRVFNPGGVLVDRSVSPNRVYVFDAGNSRVLGLSHLGACAGGNNAGANCTTNSDCPTSTCTLQEGRGADLVLGQPSFTRSACNGDGAFQRYPNRATPSAATLCILPEDAASVLESQMKANMAVDGSGNLYVPDLANNRILRYESPFTTTSRDATYVWGQAGFTTRECNRGRGVGYPDNQSLCLYSGWSWLDGGVGIDAGGNLWVADYTNNRVVRFPKDSVTGVPGQTADLVLGQPDFSSWESGSTLDRMSGPDAVRIDASGTVYVADSINHRVLIFDPPVFTGMAGRALVFDFGHANDPGGGPDGLELDPLTGGLWVNDPLNTQILLFVGGAVQKVLLKDEPTNFGGCPCRMVPDPDHPGNYMCAPILGGDGPDFTYGDGTVAASWRLCVIGGNIGVDSDGNVFAAGLEQQDVWRFPGSPWTQAEGIFHSADARLFPQYQGATPNEIGLGGFFDARGVAVARNQLIVADRMRLMFWNNPPNLANGQAADGLVAQTDPRVQAGPTFGTLRVDGLSRLWTARNDQIVVYDLPLQGGDTPFATLGPPLPVLGGGTVTWDWGLAYGSVEPVGAGSKVWFSDPHGNRVFRVRNPLTSPMVDIILGQTSATGTDCNQGRGPQSPDATSLCNPGGLALDPQGNLYVADDAAESSGNFRLLEFDAASLPDSPPTALFAIPASRVFGTGGSFTVPGCVPEEVCSAAFQPALKPDGQMVVGGNDYLNPRFPYVYTNPLVSQRVSGFLNDYYSWPGAATFDSSGNLYVTDGVRDRVLIYLNPLSTPPPATFTLTVGKTGGGTGMVTSEPFGIDCGTACSRAYINGTIVTLAAIPDASFIFAGWSGDADCADGVVTMNANKTCTATFQSTASGDLIVSALTAPATGGAGLAITVTDTTKNQGTGSVAASTTKFFLSTNTTWDAGDVNLGARSVLPLAPAATSTGSTSLTLPSGTAAGTYYVIARADADGLIPETNETNNNRTSGAIKIGPDLIVSALTVPATGGAGLSMTVTDTTKNQTGTSTAPASTTRFYLSTNTTWDVGDVYLGSRAIPPLAAAATSTGLTSPTIPSETAPGTYYVIAKADADSLIVETNEMNNNRASGAIKIGSDLFVSALTAPATGGAGLAITVTDTTTNQTGTSTAPASTTRFYLSTNTTWDAGDVYLGVRSIPSLAAGAASTGSTSLTLPSGTATGSYYVIAKADADGLVVETNENNNNRTSAAIKIGPDLIVSALTVPATGGAGLAITVTDTTKNQGGGPAAASTTAFYLSTNTTWDASDVSLGSRSIPALDAGVVSTASTSLTIPAGTASGSYYVIGKADADGLVPETSETNNTLARAIKIGPDLIVSALTAPATGTAGGTITVTDTTRNQTGMSSAPASTTRFYLSTNTAWDAGDVDLGFRTIPSLAAGATSVGSTSLTIPSGTAPGTYYVIAKADADSLIWETSETNNTRASGTIRIGPDLIVSALTAPTSAAAGAAITLTDTTKNQGGSLAAASTTSFSLSTNTTSETGDVYLGSRSIPSLGALATSAGSTPVRIPAGMVPGAYYILARADATDAAVEASETNNVTSRAITISQ